MSNVEKWSLTAASNNDAPPDGAPEGMNKTDVNDTMREFMAAVRTWYDDPEFLDLMDAYTVTRESATEVRVAAVNAVSYFNTGRRIRITGGVPKAGVVASVVFSSPDTIVTVDLDGNDTVPIGTDTILLHAHSSLGAGAFGTGDDYLARDVFSF